MRATTLALICMALALALILGCTKYQRTPSAQVSAAPSAAPNDAGGFDTASALPSPQPFDLDAPKFSGGGSCNQDMSIMDAANKNIVCRNRLALSLTARSDAMCAQRMALFMERSKAINSQAAEIFSEPEGIAPLLLGSAQKPNSAQGIGEQDISAPIAQDVFVAMILRQVGSQRHAQLMEIQRRFEENTAKYSAERMLIDVEEYHRRCSVLKALEYLSRTAGSTSVPK